MTAVLAAPSNSGDVESPISAYLPTSWAYPAKWAVTAGSPA